MISIKETSDLKNELISKAQERHKKAKSFKQFRRDVGKKPLKKGEVRKLVGGKWVSNMDERKMTSYEKDKKEKYVKGMKKVKGDFTKRYGKDGKSVMYATATKMAMKEESCGKGEYYCYDDKKCKPIPEGMKVGKDGMLVKEMADFSLDDLEKPIKKEYDLTNPRERAAYSRLKKMGKNPLIKKVTEGSLHKWFKGSKSKDGKGGWVNVVTGGTCASDEPGEGTPKCVSSAKRASMTKAERLSAARRKKKADPGQQQKSGAAKPTYVRTDKPKKKTK